MEREGKGKGVCKRDNSSVFLWHFFLRRDGYEDWKRGDSPESGEGDVSDFVRRLVVVGISVEDTGKCGEERYEKERRTRARTRKNKKGIISFPLSFTNEYNDRESQTQELSSPTHHDCFQF